MTEETKDTATEEAQWPNQEPVVDGVVPSEEVPQDPDLPEDEDDDPDLELEMED